MELIMEKPTQDKAEFLEEFDIFLEKHKLYIHPRQKKAIIIAQAENFKRNQEIRSKK